MSVETMGYRGNPMTVGGDERIQQILAWLVVVGMVFLLYFYL